MFRVSLLGKCPHDLGGDASPRFWSWQEPFGPSLISTSAPDLMRADAEATELQGLAGPVLAVRIKIASRWAC